MNFKGIPEIFWGFGKGLQRKARSAEDLSSAGLEA